MKFAIITADTAVYQGTKENEVLEAVSELLEINEQELVYEKALPLDLKVVSTILERMSDSNICDVIFVTGGCGVKKGDITPEATMQVVDRAIPGIPEQMRSYLMTYTDKAMLCRCQAGVRGQTLIVDLPEKAATAKAAAKFLLPQLISCVELLKED